MKHKQMPFAAYLALDGINYSTLKHFNRSPKHAKHEMTTPSDQTPAQELGQAVHCAILEPDKFHELYIRAPKVDKRTKKGKETWQAFLIEAGDKTPLRDNDWTHCLAMQAAVWDDSTCKELLSGQGFNEAVYQWSDDTTGILCKMRLDRLTRWADWSTIVDLKTTTDARPGAFARSCAKYDYHEQAAFYLDGLAALAPTTRRFIHIAIESDPPHCPAVYELDQVAIDCGRAMYHAALDQYKIAKESNHWPGYPSGVLPLCLPRWKVGGEYE